MLENRNQLEIEQKLKREMEREGLDALILTEPETILYASGFASHFLYDSRRIGTTLAVVRKEGPVILILNEIEKQTAENQCWIADNDYPEDIDYRQNNGEMKAWHVTYQSREVA